MSEYSAYMKQAKKEVESSLNIWRTIFEEEYSETIDYVYCKGCGICAAECPTKKIEMKREAEVKDD